MHFDLVNDLFYFSGTTENEQGTEEKVQKPFWAIEVLSGYGHRNTTTERNIQFLFISAEDLANRFQDSAECIDDEKLCLLSIL